MFYLKFYFFKCYCYVSDRYTLFHFIYAIAFTKLFVFTVYFVYKQANLYQFSTRVHSKKKLKHFATKSSEIIISSRRAGSTLQKRSLLYKKFLCFFLISLMMLDFVIQGLYDIQIKTNKFCIARMYSCMCGT
jgi:hypothetical protein